MATYRYFMVTDYLVSKVKGFEGVKLTAYRDPKGVLTVGTGHTKGVKEGMRISMAQAEQFLKEDLQSAASYVNRQHVCETQGNFDALVDFAFNLGTRSLGRSTLMHKIKQGRPTPEIQAQFRRWVYAGKEKLPGLVKRREWEAQRWAQQ